VPTKEPTRRPTKEPTKRPTKEPTENPTEYCIPPIDFTIVFDESNTVEEVFDSAKKFLVEFVKKLDVGATKHHVSLIEYAGRVVSSIKFSDSRSRNKQELIKYITGTKYMGGWTDTARAIEVATELQSETRVGIKKVVVLITDGLPQTESVKNNIQLNKKRTISYAKKLTKLKQTYLQCFGIGNKFWPSTENGKALLDRISSKNFEVVRYELPGGWPVYMETDWFEKVCNKW
jgi:hypothetical protein